MGRQGGGIMPQNVQIVDNKRATGYKNLYESPKDLQAKHHPQNNQKQTYSSGPKLTTVLSENIKTTTKSKQSSGNSEDCNQAADEDNQSSYIQYRNAYLDDEIKPAAEGSSQFKQEPKMAKGTQPNPNLYTQSQPHTSLATHQNVLSPLSLQGPNMNLKQSNANRRIFDTNQMTTMALQNQRSICSQLAIQGPTQLSTHKKTASGPQVGQIMVSQNIAKNGARRVVPQQKHLIEFVSPLTDKIMRPNTQMVVMPQSQKMAQTQKLQSEDQPNSSRKPHPMFQILMNEDQSASKKQAMIHQFEMNLNPQNKAAALVYSQREMTGQSGSMQGLMNKATLCDSAASKMNNNSTGSNSQFLRKSLWLLTNSKSRALKELVHQNKPACSLCNYIHSYSHLTIAANIQGSAVKQPHAQSIFQMTHHCNATKVGTDNYFSMQAGPSDSHALHRMVVSQQKISLETSKNRSNQNNTAANGARSTIQSRSLHQQQISLQPNLGNVQSNSRINLEIKSPKSPQTPGSPTTPESQRNIYISSHRKLRRNVQQKGNSTLSTSNASQQKNQNFQISSGSAYMQQMNSIILQQELHERFEAQYFYYLIKNSLIAKYMTSQEYYNSKVSSDIMYNEQRHIVSVFKEYLIYDDFSEYLKRFYLRQESSERLPRIFEFYEHYSKVFPNYVAIPESKYMFKNIERKQKLIDQRHQNFLRNQKKEKGEIKSDRSSAVILFNSVFLKEVFDEPTMRDSLLSDPRDISINQFSRVLNNPPQQKMIDSYSMQNLNASKNHRELADIIQLLGKFDKFDDNSIMTRELVSNSLIIKKGSGVYLNTEIEHVMMIGPHKSKEQLNRLTTEVNDLTMSSWNNYSMTINDQQIFAKQDLEFEIASEIQASLNHSMIDLQKTPKISALPHGKFAFSKAKPFKEGPQVELRQDKKDLDQIKDFLNGDIEEGIQIEKKSNKQVAQNRGIHQKQISVPIQSDQEKTNTDVQGSKLTRNQELGQSKQQPKTITASSQNAAPVLRPSVKSAVKTLSVFSNEVQNSRTQIKEQSEIQPKSNNLRNVQTQLANHQSQDPPTFKQSIQNLMVEANKVLNSNKKSKESLNQKRTSVVEQNQMPNDKVYVTLRNKDKPSQERANFNQGSRNDQAFEEKGSNSFEALAKQSMPLLQPRISVINIEAVKPSQEVDLNQIYKFTKHGSRASLVAAATHQPQSLQKVFNFNKFEEEQQTSAINLKVNRRHALGGNIILDLNDEQHSRLNKQSKLMMTESRKIKTSVGLRDQDFLSEGAKTQVHGNIFVENRPLTKQYEHSNFEQLKAAKTTIQSLMNTQHMQSKKTLASKPNKNSNQKPVQSSLPSKEQQIALNHVYQSSNQGRSTNQITPYALLNYYSKDVNSNVESQKQLQQPLNQPEGKERTSKSEGLQKSEKFVKNDHYQTRQEQNTPLRITTSTEQITNCFMADQATLAAVKYFQSNLHSSQSNPYEKTGRLQSVASISNSGKGSAGGIKNLVLNISSSKGRNKLPNQSKNTTIKVNPACIVKPGSSLSNNALSNHGSAQKLPGSVVMMNNLPNQGGTGGSLKSGHSNLSLKAQQQIYTIKTSDQLFNLGQKSSTLMKKSTPSSLTSSGKAKKKTVAIIPTNKVAKLGKAEGVKKGFPATQGHTIFSVNSRQNQ